MQQDNGLCVSVGSGSLQVQRLVPGPGSWKSSHRHGRQAKSGPGHVQAICHRCQNTGNSGSLFRKAPKAGSCRADVVPQSDPDRSMFCI
mgnify:CR=1 FL=1